MNIAIFYIYALLYYVCLQILSKGNERKMKTKDKEYRIWILLYSNDHNIGSWIYSL